MAELNQQRIGIDVARGTIEVRNPATLEKIAEVPSASSLDVSAAVLRARQAQKEWQTTSFAHRARILYRLRDGLLDEQERLADILTNETGGPRAEVYGNELFYLCDVIGYWARRAPRYLKAQRITPHLLKGKKVLSTYAPIGVVGIISPWNFPLILSLGEALPALMAGNAVVQPMPGFQKTFCRWWSVAALPARR
jgi:acyl-CoA reductase-like NAD-dependent aldehyde dehydrogenase